MKHTPGPYKLDWLKNGGCNIDPEDGHGRIATVWVRYNKTDNLAEISANALLIASAPDLLEACRFTLLCINENWLDLSNSKIQLEQAIAKAEGRGQR